MSEKKRYDVLAGSIDDFFSAELSKENIPDIIGQEGNPRHNSPGGNSGKANKVDTKNALDQKKGPTRVYSFKLDEETVTRIKDIAYWQRRSIRDVVEDAFRLYINNTPEEDKRPR